MKILTECDKCSNDYSALLQSSECPHYFCCIDGIDDLVLKQPQGSLLHDIRLSLNILQTTLTPAVSFYWKHRLSTYVLALEISLLHFKERGLGNTSETMLLRRENAALRTKLYDRIARKVTVSGGIKQ